MNFDFLPGSSRTFSKTDLEGRPVAADAQLVARLQQNGPGLTRHHRQVAMQIIVAAFLLAALVLAGRQLAGQAQLVLTVGDQQRVFEGRVTSGMTILDALNASVLAGDIHMRFSVDQQTGKTFVWTLDGYQGTTQPVTLRVLLNNDSVDAVRIHRAPVTPGDIIAVQVMAR